MTTRAFVCALAVALAALLSPGPAAAQFIDNFDRTTVDLDPSGAKGWHIATGDGTATMAMRHGGPGYASVLVDATTDRRGIWWALVERSVSDNMNLALLQEKGHALRIEARVRSSHAPRRINLQLLTNRTTDYHSNLAEYDIPDTADWHTFSLTVPKLEVRPGDRILGHLALMDWGLDRYQLDIDYIRVDIVDTATAGPDKGNPVPYHPPVADVASFAQHVPVSQDSTIDLENTSVNLNDWYSQDENGSKVNLLSADGTHYVILRWDLSAFAGKKIDGSGLLELTTYSVQQKSERLKDFGIVRVSEIVSGDQSWDQHTVTTDSLRNGLPLNHVINPQMIIDSPVTEVRGGKTYLTISNPTLQRMVDGKAFGIAIRPLGAISAAFYSLEGTGGNHAAVLHFNVKP